MTCDADDRLSASGHRAACPPTCRCAAFASRASSHLRSTARATVGCYTTVPRRTASRPVRLQRRREVGRHRHFARCGVEFDVDIDRVAACDAGTFTHRRADADHEPSIHRRHAAPVRVAVDGDGDLRALPGAEARHHLVRHVDACRCLVALQDRRSEPHVPPSLGAGRFTRHDVASVRSVIAGMTFSPYRRSVPSLSSCCR